MVLSREECFNILGLNPAEATESDIKTAYKKLALKTHPDKIQMIQVLSYKLTLFLSLN